MRYLADQPVEACPPSAWYRFSKFARRNRAALTTVAWSRCALIAGTAVSTWQAIRANAARRADVRRARGRAGPRQLQRERPAAAVDEMYTQVAEKWLAQQAR